MKWLKQQKGLTLIELLAVIVILGIIAAIAIPSVNNIISGARENAHIENAKRLIAYTKTYVSIEGINTSQDFSLAQLISSGYVQSADDPSNDGKSYNRTQSVISLDINPQGQATYSVCLADEGGTYYIGARGACIPETQLSEDGIVKNF